MPDPSSSATAGRRMEGPPVSSGGFGAGLADGLPETVKKSSHPEADALPLAEAELTAQAAEAADANISTPIMDSATNKSSFFTISPSVASHPIAMLGTRLCLGQGAPLFTLVRGRGILRSPHRA